MDDDPMQGYKEDQIMTIVPKNEFDQLLKSVTHFQKSTCDGLNVLFVNDHNYKKISDSLIKMVYASIGFNIFIFFLLLYHHII